MTPALSRPLAPCTCHTVSRATRLAGMVALISLCASPLRSQPNSNVVRLSRAADTAGATTGERVPSHSGIVRTPTGEREARTLGYSRTRIDVADALQRFPVFDMSQLLAGQVAGLQIQQSGTTGAGTRVRLRAPISLALSNEPLVLVDGIRVISGAGSLALPTGGEAPSRLNDLNPEDFAEIEVFSGPSATTLFGADAANGVILMTTRSGQRGGPRFRLYSEGGVLHDVTTYPSLYAGWDTTGDARRCRLAQQAVGECSVDSLTFGSVLNVEELAPFGIGSRQQLGLQVDGGGAWWRYYAAVERAAETDPYRMPSFERERLQAARDVESLPFWQLRPAALERRRAQLGLTISASRWATLRLTSAFLEGRQRLPDNGDTPTALMVSALGGAWQPDARDENGVPLRGYRLHPVGTVFALTNQQDAARGTHGAQLMLSPASWLTARATVGVDRLRRDELRLQRRGEGWSVVDGSVLLQDVEHTRQTFDWQLAAQRSLPLGLSARTTIGAQDARDWIERRGREGQGLPTGSSDINDAELQSSIQLNIHVATRALFLEQQLAIVDRLFLTGAVRRERSLLAGQSASNAYTHIGASYALRDAGAAPVDRAITSLVLRAAYGEAGRRPFGDDPDANRALLVRNAGFEERNGEWSAGADATLWAGRSELSATVFRATTRNALVLKEFATTLAEPGGRRYVAEGITRGSGVELSLRQQLLRGRRVAASVLVSGSTNRTTVNELAAGVSVIGAGNRNSLRLVPGYPRLGFWQFRHTATDANGDGIIAPTDVSVADTAEYLGPSFPTRELSIVPTVSTRGGRLRLSAHLDSRWGFRKFNNTARHQCQAGLSCRALFDASAPLADQAAAIAARDGRFAAFIEDGAFTRLRAVSVSYDLPDRWARAARADAWSITALGTNLAVCTRYRGTDPEAGVDNSDERGHEEFFSTPPRRALSLRVTITY